VAVQSFVDAAHRVVVTMASGDVTLSDAIGACTALRENPAFEPGFVHVGDLSRVSRLQLGISEIYEVFRNDPFANVARRAVVAPRAGHTQAMARVYQSLVPGSMLEIFSSLAEALAWIGFEATVLEPPDEEVNAAVLAHLENEPTVIELPVDVPTSFRRFRHAG
jgi:hypothetical protein